MIKAYQKEQRKTQTKFGSLLQNKQKQIVPYTLIFIRQLCLSFFADSTQEQIGLGRLELSCFIMLSLLNYSLCTKTKSPSMQRTAYCIKTK